MPHALINASIIWLCSLLIYELLLKGHTFHRLNRGYLLLTFIAGIVLPALPWGAAVRIVSADMNIGSAAIVHTHPASAESPSTTPGGINPLPWLLILYLTGVAGSALYFLRDLLRLRALYGRASKRREGPWLIAETGGAHSPFSLLHIIFVGSREQYSDQQWRMILQHEQQHCRSRHIIDLALMHLAAVLIWFHPLVHIYRFRLQLLHEYEVDSLQSEDVWTYGSFLLEQAALAPSPLLTHSLSFSPLKNRIQMMTKNPSKQNARFRFLLLLPLMSLFIWCCTKNRPTVAVDINGRYAVRHDAKVGYRNGGKADTVTMEVPANEVMDTVVLIDRETGKEKMVVTKKTNEKQVVQMMMDDKPNQLDGQQILLPGDLASKPACQNPGPSFGLAYLIEKAELASTFGKMNDGTYYMSVSDIIVDKSGRVVYYMMTFPENDDEATTDPGGFMVAKPSGLTDADKEAIQRKISSVLIGGDVSFTAGKNKQGVAVPCFLSSDGQNSGFPMDVDIVVKGHKVMAVKPRSDGA